MSSTAIAMHPASRTSTAQPMCTPARVWSRTQPHSATITVAPQRASQRSESPPASLAAAPVTMFFRNSMWPGASWMM